MQENEIVRADILGFRTYLINMERSARTIDKYCRDVGAFIQYLAPGKLVTRETVIEYKSYLQGAYKISSANSMLAALNCFFHYKNWDRYRVSQFKVQRRLMGVRKAGDNGPASGQPEAGHDYGDHRQYGDTHKRTAFYHSGSPGYGAGGDI